MNYVTHIFAPERDVGRTAEHEKSPALSLRNGRKKRGIQLPRFFTNPIQDFVLLQILKFILQITSSDIVTVFYPGVDTPDPVTNTDTISKIKFFIKE